jgi:hypothetical protein
VILWPRSKELIGLNKYEKIFAKLKSDEERRAMYRKLLKEVHPDVGGTNEEVRALIEAYKNCSTISAPAYEEPDEEPIDLYKWAKDVLAACGINLPHYVKPAPRSRKDFLHNIPAVGLYGRLPPENLLKVEEALRQSWGRVLLDIYDKPAFTPLDIWTLGATGAPVKLIFSHKGRAAPYTILTRRYLTYIGYDDLRDWSAALKAESVFFDACYHKKIDREEALYKNVCSQLIWDGYAKGRRAVECYYDKKTMRAYVMHCSTSLKLKDFLPDAETKAVSEWLI